MDSQGDYQLFVKLPIIGKIPLLPNDIISDLKLREGSPVWAQFFKYGVFGVLSAGIMITVTISIQWLAPTFLDLNTLGNTRFSLHLMTAHALGFIPCNFFTYYTNRAFVFSPSKHRKRTEFSWFTGLSLLSFGLGELGVYWVRLGYSDGGDSAVMIATILFILIATAVNFITRRLFIFAS